MKTYRPRLLLLATVSLIYSRAVNSTCYNLDGSAVNDTAVEPCNQIAGISSMCCITNTTGEIVPENCESNGLCGSGQAFESIYWLRSCTDSTWQSPYCLYNFCTPPESVDDDSMDGVPVTTCDDGTWCCGNNQTCCDEGQGVSLAATIGVYNTNNSAPSSTTVLSNAGSAATTTGILIVVPSFSGTPTNSPAYFNDNGPDKDNKVKIGVAVGLSVLLLIAVMVIKYIQIVRKKHKAAAEAGPADNGSTAQELPVSEAPQELSELKGPAGFQHELEGDQPPILELPDITYPRGTLPTLNRYM